MGFSREDFEKHAYNGPVYNTIDDDTLKLQPENKEVVIEKLRYDKYLSSLDLFFFKFFRYISNYFLKGKCIDYRVVRWKSEHYDGLTKMETILAKMDLSKVHNHQVELSDYINKWGTSFLDKDDVINHVNKNTKK